MIAIEFQGVSKRYCERMVLSHLSFQIEKGERIAIHGKQRCASLKPKWTAKTKVHSFGRGDGCFRHHDELALVGLDTGEPRLGFGQRLTHMKRFFKEHNVGLVVAREL